MAPDKLIIREQYKDYVPPVNVKKTIKMLLSYVPPADLFGIEEIVLTNVSALSREERRKKGSSGIRPIQSRGRYRPTWKGQAAQIYLFVDNNFEGFWNLYLKVPFCRNYILAEVLFHEIGHHIQYSSKSQAVGKERFARRYEAKLTRRFTVQHYWYMNRVRWAFDGLSWLIRKLGVKEFVEKHAREGK